MSDVFPWWAISILKFHKDEELLRHTRKAMQGAFDGDKWQEDKYEEAKAVILQRALQLAEEHPIEWWRERCAEDEEIATKVREGALHSEAAFVQWCGFKDDEDAPMVLAPFHVRAIRGMRQHSVAEVLLPLEHGKSFHSSITVPLMDWAEWHNAAEGRFYWNETHVVKWINYLMFHVEHNHCLHQIFPWIRRPEPGDVSMQWSQNGFAIGGRTIPGRSFEPLTARAYSVGNRYARCGGDDWVTEGNSESEREQDKLFNYWNSGPLTMTQNLKRQSPFGTAWPGAYYTGTLYDRRDVGSRIRKQLHESGDFTMLLDVYPEGAVSPEIVLWPEGRSPEYIARKRLTMSPATFNARYRNRVVVDDEQPFPEDKVELALKESYQFGVLPGRARAVIGFDPASGSKKRYAANPAICLYAEVYDRPDVEELQPGPFFTQIGHDPDEDRDEAVRSDLFVAHWVKWQRLSGYDFERQCQTIVQWADEYKLDVVIEKNTTQTAYRDHLRKIAPHIRVVDHQTGAEKWNAMDGVATFTPLFNNERVVIHVGQAPVAELKALFTELVEYPQSRTSDLIMAFWFARARLSKRRRGQISSTVLQTPGYLGGMTRYWNLT